MKANQLNVGDDKIFRERLALGIFVEGQYLHVAALRWQDKRVRLIDAQIIKLKKSLESVKTQEKILSEVLTDLSEENIPVELSEAMSDGNWLSSEAQADPDNNMEILSQLLQRYAHPKNRIGISLSEPQIYYNLYDSDWGLSGKKLILKILDELSKERQEGEPVEADDLRTVRLEDDRLLAIVRDKDINILNLFQYLRSERRIRIPLISLVESAEISLVNLINANYHFEPEEVSVIVYLGNEFSRLIFMKGQHIYNISYLIGAGLDSENIRHTIFSRIFLEQDNLNLPQIQNIILTGEAYEVGLKEFLQHKLSDSIKIDYLKLKNLEVLGNEPLVSKFAVALGCAWRTLKPSEKNFYDVNLLPADIRESQKWFKLGWSGWILLLLLPLVAFFSTVKIIEHRQALQELIKQRQLYQEELTYLQDLELQLNTRKSQLKNYNNAFAVLDSMTADANIWSDFLARLSRIVKNIGEIWITEMNPKSNSTATLKGYAIYRNRIPQLSARIGNGALKRVEVQEIRGRTVYFFEMEASLKKQ